MWSLSAALHDVDPWVIRFTQSFGVRWYGLAYVLGFAGAWFVLLRLAKAGRFRANPERVGDVILAAVLGTLVGGRLGYVLFYRPDLLTDFSGDFPFWGAINIAQGGMASHGGMIGLVLAAWWVALREKTSLLHVADMLALVAPIGVFFGRLANFVNGELLGKVVAQPGEDAPAWAVRYPQELLERATPEQIEAAAGLVSRFQLWPPQSAFADPDDLLRLGLERLIVEVQAGNADVQQAIEPILHARHPSQLYQAAVEGLLLGGVLWFVFSRKPRDGVITAVFLMVYGVGRIATEFVRLPDTHLGRTLGLSRGQWLSAAMVVIGAVLLVWVMRKRKSTDPRSRVGGAGEADSSEPEQQARSA